MRRSAVERVDPASRRRSSCPRAARARSAGLLEAGALEAQQRADAAAGRRAPRAPSDSTEPPCARTWCTARSTPSRAARARVPSSGHEPVGRRARGRTRALVRRRGSRRACDEQQRRHGRRRPPRASAPSPAAARPLRPASSRQRSSACCSCRARASVEVRPDDLEQLGRRRVRLGGRPADDRLARLGRERRLDLAAHLLRRDDHHLQAARARAPACRSRRRPPSGGRCTSLLDVPLVARLRPPALVVLPGLLLALVDDLLEPAGAQTEDLPALAADEGDERSVAAADERDERRERRGPCRAAPRPATGSASGSARQKLVERRREHARRPRRRRGRTRRPTRRGSASRSRRSACFRSPS